MNFNPVGTNQVWAGDVTYLKTGEGWMYLAIVMDLFSRRIVGWHIDKRMTTDLIYKAMVKAYTQELQNFLVLLFLCLTMSQLLSLSRISIDFFFPLIEYC